MGAMISAAITFFVSFVSPWRFSLFAFFAYSASHLVHLVVLYSE